MHVQHRERLRQRVLRGEKLAEHEILELILFNALPRVNTNEIAHNLIDTFGSIQNVLTADAKLLSVVKGVGESTAAYLSVLGEVLKNHIEFSENQLPKVFSYNQIKEPIKLLFKNIKEEVFVQFLLDSEQKIIAQKSLCTHSANNVKLDLKELTTQVLLTKPTFVVIAHNHLSRICKPTASDDDATLRIAMLLMLHGVKLVDHLIVTNDEVYSYYFDNRLDDIIQQSTLALNCNYKRRNKDE